MTNHIVPTRTERDPTRQAGNRLRAKVEISRRVRSVRESVIQMLDGIPVDKITVNKTRYEYRVSPDKMAGLLDELEFLFYQALEVDYFARGWFLNQYLGNAWQDGTTQAFTRLKSLAESAAPDIAEAMNLDSVLTSPEYARRFELVSARSFENMKGFAGQAARDLGQILGQGIALGQSPRIIARDIREKFDQIEGYRSLRIARTEINHSYREARYEETKDVRDRLGLEVKVMHISALIDTTRRNHADRHGKLYTLEEQREWWATGSNEINCLCSTAEVVFINGKPTQEKLIDRQRKRGELYFKQNGIEG